MEPRRQQQQQQLASHPSSCLRIDARYRIGRGADRWPSVAGGNPAGVTDVVTTRQPTAERRRPVRYTPTYARDFPECFPTAVGAMVRISCCHDFVRGDRILLQSG